MKLVCALLVCLVGCADKPGLGEACSTSNSTDECDSGLVCTKEAAQTVCRKQCTTQADCPTATTCSGIAGGSLHSCQPTTP